MEREKYKPLGCINMYNFYVSIKNVVLKKTMWLDSSQCKHTFYVPDVPVGKILPIS